MTRYKDKPQITIRNGRPFPKEFKYNCKLEINNWLVPKFKEVFEIEFMQGELIPLANDMTLIYMNISEEKAEQFKRLLNQMLFGSETGNPN